MTPDQLEDAARNLAHALGITVSTVNRWEKGHSAPSKLARASLARRRTRGQLLFDIRGFWADERVEGGLWPAGGRLYRLARRCERRFYGEADGIVTLTEASQEVCHSSRRGKMRGFGRA